ncbi:MAG: malate dehydrogenase, partial [Selenomonadaceae bacterium]|nr:malate dehydrogenase [Selenomonadaceae bacterium]
NFDTTVTGVTNNYAATAGSQVVVVTSGIPRKPGMTREQLIGTNAKIVKSVVDQILEHSPEAILIIVSNPMDAMTYLTLKDTKLPRNRIIGQGGMLDSSRFRYYLSIALQEAGYPATPTDIDGMVVGGHADKTMVPLVSLATYRGIPVTQLLSDEAIQKAVEATKVGGATCTKLLGTSAWYAPGAAAAALVEAIALDAKKLIPCCVYLEGEYGEKDLCIGVPVILGKNGIEKIVEVEFSDAEKAKFAESVAAAREVNSKIAGALE